MKYLPTAFWHRLLVFLLDKVAHIYSDNGTAFVGATNTLKKDQIKFFSELKHRTVSENVFQSIDWDFIPPGAPHMGGL